jgi:hypothetical protein
LECLYLGGSLYGFAAALYALFCPTLIKKYPGGAEYLVAESDYFSNPKNLEYLIFQIKKARGSAPIDIAERIRNSDGSLTRTQLGDVFAAHYIALNYSRLWARVASGLGFTLGILLVGVPSLWTFVEVFLRLLRNL